MSCWLVSISNTESREHLEGLRQRPCFLEKGNKERAGKERRRKNGGRRNPGEKCLGRLGIKKQAWWVSV